jgi:hypothetical protein
MVILLMLLLGSGGAYAYFKMTAPPPVHSDSGTPTSSPAVPSSSGGFQGHPLPTA